ncbi:MAG: type II toxin-antitoxin system RelB/DinJ family antitoxin [Clostridiales bacterium]|nr:type II toxin-antitoxin system RelB/DinJ family antitoxin [Clostridiales bacterium]
MATTNISIRIDTKLKSDLQNLVSNLGLDMTAFFTMAAKQAVREQGIPFKSTMHVPNQDTLDAMAEVEYMMKHPEKGKSYNSFAELMSDLDDEDDE